MVEGSYRDLVENLPIGIFQTRPDGRLVWVNRALARVFGYSSPEEMISEIADVGRDAYADPEERASVLATAIREGQIAGAEARMRRKNGEEFPASIAFRVVRDSSGQIRCLEGSLEDVTERRRMESAVRLSEQKYRELVENANSIILRWTRDGRITFFRPRVIWRARWSFCL